MGSTILRELITLIEKKDGNKHVVKTFWRVWQLRKSNEVKRWLLKHELLSLHMYSTTALSNSMSVIICLPRPPIIWFKMLAFGKEAIQVQTKRQSKWLIDSL